MAAHVRLEPLPRLVGIRNLFRKEYNEDRPHEALSQKPPASVFLLSARTYPTPLVRFEVAPWNQVVRVDKSGFIRWNGTPLYISSALIHEDIELRYDGDREQWHVVFGPLSLGWIREAPALAFHPSKGRMADQVEREAANLDSKKVSGMSPD